MAGIYEIFIQVEFSAAHSLRGYKGDCADIHGHNWTVEVFMTCTRLNEIGIGIDFREARQKVKEIIEELDHTDLNSHPAFLNVNPSSENLAGFLYREIKQRINSDSVRVSGVKVSESPGSGVIYREE